MGSLTKYTVKRLVALIPVLAGISLITFASIRLIPGGPAEGLLGTGYNPAAAAAIDKQLNLNRPIWSQYVSWIAGVLHGDLGNSLVNGTSVISEIRTRLPYTLELTSAAIFVSLIIAVPAGVLAARRPGGIFDVVASSTTIIGISVPDFVVGTVFVIALALKAGFFPTGGTAPSGSSFSTQLSYLALPALSLAGGLLAITLRMMRSSFLEVARLDFVRTARAKGLKNRQVILSHIFRNSLIPVVTVVGIQIGYLLGGTVVIEKVFSWPGMGSLLVDSIVARDYTTVQGVVMLYALLFVLVNFLADMAILSIDPRLRRG